MKKAQIGVYGLGTMGRALALNLAEKGFSVAITNREPDWISEVLDQAGPLAARLVPSPTLKEFVDSISGPRNLLFMIPSGTPMDDMIAKTRPLLGRGDTIIDGGNADFNLTRARSAALADFGLHYVGMGVSGGAEGARSGPSLMFGGSDHSWKQLGPLLQAIAAQYEGDPCVAHVGPDGAGHFVKTVHNGIEYADMQMIAEVYGLLRDGAGWSAEQIGDLFTVWNSGPLASFLVEITGQALHTIDPETGQPMVDVIVDSAGQKGTGRWTVIEALKLGQSASAIEAAVGARAWSSQKDVRLAAEPLFASDPLTLDVPPPEMLADALLAGRILSHAQGFETLNAASAEFDWSLDLARIAEIWRAGCIIRSALLDDVALALRDMPSGHLILSPVLRSHLAASVPALRQVVSMAVMAGLPVPSLSGALTWFDSLRQGRGTANVIQAQRDVFGAHGFERVDRSGRFHGQWMTSGND